MKLAELAGRRVVVWGLGNEGRAGARAAVDAGAAEVTAVTDTAPGDDMLGAWSDAGLASVPVMVAADAAGTQAAADVLLLSPGVSRYRPEITAAEARGAVVTNGTAIFLAEHGAHTVTVTGSKGKSTVTRLTAHLLQALGRDAEAAGNIGTPLLELVGSDRLIVAEVSSYQASLVDTGAAVAVLTSLFPEHLPWHGDADHYYADKLRLFTPDDSRQHALVNAADPGVRSMLSVPALAAAVHYGEPGSEVHVANGQMIVRGAPAFTIRRSLLPGAHNEVNIAAAVAVVAALGFDAHAEADRLEAALARFAPLPHRLETIATVGGITFIDDTLATTPQAAIAACEAFADRPVVLLTGGLDRGVDYAPLAAYLEDRASRLPVAVVVMDEAGRRLAASLRHVKAEQCDDVTAAVGVAASIVDAGGVVILAPAAPSPASYENNYERRSEAFRAGVLRLQQSS